MSAVTRGRSGGVRTYVLDLPDQERLSANDMGQGFGKRHRLTSQWRHDVGWIAHHEAIPRLERARLELVVSPPDRKRRDLTNLWPVLKAAEDGLRDAGVLPDDDMTRVVHVGIRAGNPTGTRWRWRLEVADAADG